MNFKDGSFPLQSRRKQPFRIDDSPSRLGLELSGLRHFYYQITFCHTIFEKRRPGKQPSSNCGHLLFRMKGNKVILLILLITVFTILFEIEGRIRRHTTGIYDRFVADITISEKQEPKVSDQEPMSVFSFLKLK